MKTKLFAPCAALAAVLLWSGCVLGGAIGSSQVALGSVYANAKLGKIDPSPAGTAAQKQAVADLERVGTDLNLFVAGKLTFEELGAVEAQLKLDGNALSGNTNALNQINTVLNILAQSVAANGVVTPQQALLQGNIANIVSGFNISIRTYKGQWSVTNPSAWPLTPEPAAP